MKSTSKISIILIIFFGLSIPGFAQVTAIASSSASIIAPITIDKNVDMNFGNLAVQTDQGGTVVMTPAGLRSKTGGVTLPVTTGTVAAAQFTVSGTEGYTYGITLPASSLIITNGSENMTIDSWTSDPTTTGILNGGSSTLKVGATLNVNAAQAEGTYTNTTGFIVTVNYN